MVVVAAAVLLIAADFSEISYRTIGIGACSDRVDPGVCRTYGHDSHSYVLVVVALVSLLMAWGAVVGRSRAAAIAVAVLGVVVLFIALAVDLPKLGDKRGLEVRYNAVSAHTGTAFKLELTGGVLLLLAGGLALVREGSDGEPWQPRRRRARAASATSAASEGPDGSAGSESAAEARARERARRRAARRGGSSAAVAEPPPADEMPPPEPGTAVRGEPEAAAPTDRPGTGADATAPTDPPETGAVASPEPDLEAAAHRLATGGAEPTVAMAGEEPAASPAADDELSPEAYRPPDAEPDPPARG